MTEQTEQIDLRKFIYDDDQEILVPFKGNALLHLIDVLSFVVERETIQTYPLSYPKSSKEITALDQDGNEQIVDVEVEWEEYPTATAFFNQIEKGAISGLTLLGTMAQDLVMMYQGVHLDNIKNNVAKKLDGNTNQ